VGEEIGLIGIMVGGKGVGVTVDIDVVTDVIVGDTDALKCNVGVFETVETAQAANNVMMTMLYNNLRDCFIRDTPFGKLRFHLLGIKKANDG
jgi:hypothetical protein